MEDRELLELAAKAAGLDLQWCDAWKCMAKWINVVDGFDRDTCWNPLKDDGQLWQLAIAMKKLPTFSDSGFSVNCGYEQVNYGKRAYMRPIVEELLGDPCKAARRVVVRTVAEIGKAMP